MSKKATMQSVEQLQKIMDFLGENGGTITTKNPGTWWKLDLEIFEGEEDDEKQVMIGICQSVSGDLIFDPAFQLLVKMQDDQIKSVDITSYESTTFFGTIYIDGDDMLHGFGATEKDELGLAERFSQFMHNMAEVGPYLTDPAEVHHFSF